MKTIKKYLAFVEPIISGLLIGLAMLLTPYFPTITPFIYILSFIIGGYKQAKEGIVELFRDKHFNVEFLMILAAVGATIIGYWTEGAILIFIFAVSGALEEYTTDKTTKEIHNLMDLQPQKARLVQQNGDMVEIASEAIKIGDKLLVLSGEIIPTDAIIIEGTSSINEAPITGEALPREKTVGEEVYGGTINTATPLTIEVRKNIEDTVLRQIVKMVDEAQGHPSQVEAFITRIEDTYVKVVLCIVAIMMILPHFIWGWSWSETFYRAMVLLVVASPCALIAAVSPATLSAISNAAKKGLLIKGGSHLENLYKVKAIAFDKTGTLTNGEPKITDLYIDAAFDEGHILEIVSSLEYFSTHPLAESIISELQVKQGEMKQLECSDVEDVPGFGIKGVVENKSWYIGKREFMNNNPLPSQMAATIEELLKAGNTMVYIQCDNQIVGYIAMADTIKAGAKLVVEKLNAYGVATILITGDNEHTAQVIGQELGIKQIIANCLPGDKLARIDDLKAEYGVVGMVGDGINDAPALAQATIGLAMGKGSDIAMEAADIILMQSDITKIIYAYELSRKLHRITLQNIVFSLIVISLLILSNLLQYINLPLGVIGHEGSTILVILNGLRLLYFKPKQ